MRALSIMRLFGGTRYFIRMISETIIDMIPFTIVLFATLIAFALQNAALFKYSEQENKTLTRYFQMAFLQSQGDDDINSDNGFVRWAFYIMRTMALPIIMFNMLIAIMGETYGEVQDTAVA